MGRREQFTVGRLDLADLGKSGGYTSMFSSSFIPPDGQAGFPPGSVIMLTNARLGMVPQWINMGTVALSAWRPMGASPGWSIAAAAKKAFISGTAGLVILTPGFGSDNGDVGFAGYYTTDDNDQLLATNVGQFDGSLTSTDSADPLAAHGINWGIVRNGGVGFWDIVYAGSRASVGGAAGEAITLTGVLATDLGFSNYSITADTATVNMAVCTANTLTITSSADPGATHGFHYMVLRPRGITRPSHYIAYAGKRTTVGGAAAEAITVTGALATDVAIVGFAVTGDTAQIRKAVVTANTLTITNSADPSTTHAHWYMLLRAYPTS